MPSDEPASQQARLREVAGVFLRLGFTAFGGPAAHVSLMEDEVVRRRGWIDRQHFLDLVSALNFIPGPNSTELAIHLGLLRAGYPGLLAAGVCFIVPAMLIILPIAYVYVRFQTLPAFAGPLAGIRAVMLAVIAAALLRFARTALKDRFAIILGILSAAAAFALDRAGVPQSELIILGAAALAGAIARGGAIRPPAACIAPMLAASAAGALPAMPHFAKLALFFLKVGATLFGSGYVLVSYLRAGLVGDLHLSPQQLTDAVAVGQVTPGPLLTTATFVGYVLGERWAGMWGGVFGGALATAAIFLPSFILVALAAPVLQRLRANPKARGALDGMNAAVVALILVVSVNLAATALPAPWVNPLPAAMTAVSLAILLAWDINSTWLILAAGALGWAVL